MSSAQPFELAVIGGGTAAIAAITEALELGMQRIALIEQRPRLGGECAFNACVPLHTMQTAARILHGLRHEAPAFGIRAGDPGLDASRLRERTQEVISSGSEPFGNDPRVFRLVGTGRLLSGKRIQAGKQTLEAERILLATGAQPTIPDIEGLDEAGYLLYPQATHLECLPESLMVIGGGRVGIELAQLYRRLGSRVILLERENRILPREDPEATELLKAILVAEGVDVRTGCQILAAERLPQGKRLSWLEAEHGAREPFTAMADEILLATGRHGTPGELNLEAAGVASDAGGVHIDATCRTTAESIWAAGDVAGPYRFTHAADYQAVVAVHNMMGAHEELGYHAMPLAYYTEPAYARVGLGESEARAMYPNLVVLRAGLEEVTRYRIENRTTGFAKILVDGETDRIVGAHVVADHAEDPIHILSLAILADVPVPRLAKMVYAYPTKAQMIQKALEGYRSAKAGLQARSELSVERSTR